MKAHRSASGKPPRPPSEALPGSLVDESAGAAAARAPTTPAASRPSGARPSTTAGRASPTSTPSRPTVRDGAGALHHHAQRQPRHLLRPVDQSVSRLRARLHLLLRAAVARATRTCRRASISKPSCSTRRTRPSCSRRSCRKPALRCSTHHARHQHRSLSAHRARATASRAPSSKCWSAPPSGRRSSPRPR